MALLMIIYCFMYVLFIVCVCVWGGGGYFAQGGILNFILVHRLGSSISCLPPKNVRNKRHTPGCHFAQESKNNQARLRNIH